MFVLYPQVFALSSVPVGRTSSAPWKALRRFRLLRLLRYRPCAFEVGRIACAFALAQLQKARLPRHFVADFSLASFCCRSCCSSLLLQALRLDSWTHRCCRSQAVALFASLCHLQRHERVPRKRQYSCSLCMEGSVRYAP